MKGSKMNHVSAVVDFFENNLYRRHEKFREIAHAMGEAVLSGMMPDNLTMAHEVLKSSDVFDDEGNNILRNALYERWDMLPETFAVYYFLIGLVIEMTEDADGGEVGLDWVVLQIMEAMGFIERI
jgi:hypothetical protein